MDYNPTLHAQQTFTLTRPKRIQPSTKVTQLSRIYHSKQIMERRTFMCHRNHYLVKIPHGILQGSAMRNKLSYSLPLLREFSNLVFFVFGTIQMLVQYSCWVSSWHSIFILTQRFPRKFWQEKVKSKSFPHTQREGVLLTCSLL